MNRRTMLQGTGTAWLTASSGAIGFDDGEGVGDLSVLLEPIHQQHRLPALAAAAVVGGKVNAAGVVGVRAAGSTEKVSADDKFHIGSCTKAMTATIVGLLVQQQKLRWDMPLAKALPQLASRMHPGYKDATVELLLCARAGFPAETAPAGKTLNDMRRLPGTISEQRQAYLKMILAQKPDETPGTKYVYSNAGYVAAGAIVEHWTKSPWEKAIKTMLFDPLGMKTAGSGWMAGKGKRDQPWGHAGDGDRRRPVPPGPGADNPLLLGPAGTIHCSIADWAKFAALHVGGGELLKDETLEKLHTPIGDQEYAMGWITAERPWGGGRVLNHAGSNTMNFAVAWLAPKKKFAALAATNCAGRSATTACDDVAEALIGKFLQG
jgi:CubicO group peptidase (beta-lactamase class C family)